MNNIRVLFLFLSLLFVSACDEKAPALKIGSKPPSFQLVDLAGNTFSFPEDLEGQPAVIRFWADWCPYCRTEMKTIEHILQSEGRTFVCLAVNVSQSKDVAEAFVQRIGITYPTLLDSDGKVARKYGVTGLPTNFFVDREGVLQSKVLGEMEENDFRVQLNTIF